MKTQKVSNPLPDQCAARVSDHNSRWPSYYQCSNKPVAASEFCKRHSPAIGAETWYRIERGEYTTSTTIIAKVFNASTESQLIEGTRRESKKTQYHQWFKSYAEAKAALIGRAKVKLQRAEQDVRTAQEMFARASVLKEMNYHD